MKRAALVVIGLVLFVLAGAAVWGLVTYGPYARWYLRVRWRAITASRREPAALEAWRNEFGDPAGTLAASPAHGDNATAARLRALGPGVGVDFNGPGEVPPSIRAIADYVSVEEMKTGDSIGAPPEAVRSYLDAHKPGVDAVVDLLTQAETPSWRTSDLGLSRHPDIPLLAINELDGVLAAEALTDSSRGRDADAERALMASWQLSASTLDCPELVGQSVAERLTTVETILVRKLASDAASWRVRLSERDARAGMMRAMVIHASQMWSAAHSQMGLAARADYLDLERAFWVKLRDLPVTAQPAGMVSDADVMRDGWSAGAVVAMIARPGDVRAWRNAQGATLQIELSDRVLQARQLKAHLGRWPAAIANIETSRIAGVHWTYGVDSDGRMSVAVSPTLEGMGLPLQFESRE
jgi:hypothetical protein